MKRFFSLLVLLVVLVGPLVSDTRAQSDEPDETSDGPVEHKLPQAVAGLRLPSSLHASGFSLSQLRPGGFNAEGRRQVEVVPKFWTDS
jgi:hypothetical protein